MKEQYYTPDISELFVGYSLQIENIENAIWGTYILRSEDRFIDIIEHKEWGSSKDAEMGLKISAANISTCCIKNKGSAGGYKWSFSKEMNLER